MATTLPVDDTSTHSDRGRRSKAITPHTHSRLASENLNLPHPHRSGSKKERSKSRERKRAISDAGMAVDLSDDASEYSRLKKEIENLKKVGSLHKCLCRSSLNIVL